MPKTTIEVHYPWALGKIGLRGDREPLSWRTSAAPDEVVGNRHVFKLELDEGEILEFKPVRGDGAWARQRNHTVIAGDSVVVEPYFEASQLSIEAEARTLYSKELKRSIRFQVALPPSYHEHHEKRYPVLYAQDGHAVLSTGADPIDGRSWEMDTTLDQLYELGAIEEILVVAIHTNDRRLETLSPSRDATHGGGDGPRYLDFMVDTLKPWIDRTYRTLPGPHEAGLIGASMGGLFSFFAAWTRSDVFGKAACLSGSFWWDNRSMVREVQKGSCPVPRPLLYIDSGAARTVFEEDANVRDGYHHTMALRQALIRHCYDAGVNIHTLAFAGLGHNNASWASRLMIPIQLLFPRKC